MTTTWFLGANSRGGFASLYSGFCAGEGDYLHVIKGGPGSGKSGFMRAIGAAAERRGLEVEYIVCSGDPDSLDGVYLPALRQGWVDGTAPHVTEPRRFGADGDYVDLFQFVGTPLPSEERGRLLQLSREHKRCCSQAYAYLAAAASLDEGCRPAVPAQLLESVRERGSQLIYRHGGKGGENHVSRRYLSANSCQGRLRLCETVTALCPMAYCLDNALGLAPLALEAAEKAAAERGLDRIVCPDPLDPSRLEALLLPKSGLALLAGDWVLPASRHVRLDVMAADALSAEARAERRRGLRARDAATGEALAKLEAAKALHDELERIYRPHVDFIALTAFTEETVARIFR